MRFSLGLVALFIFISSLPAQTLPGTAPLKMEGDLAADMVKGIGKYLDRATQESVKERQKYWKPDFSSPEAYVKSIEPNREHFKKIIGLVDERVLMTGLEYVATTDQPALVAETKKFKVYTVRWPVLKGMDAEGLLLQPVGKVAACVVAVPDADDHPEEIAGLIRSKNDPKGRMAFAQRLAEHGCQVLIPTLIDRADTWSNNPKINRYTNQPHREFVYRMAYEMGRHIIGYEVQKVLAAVDWFARGKDHPPIGVIGYGEGGLIAFYSGAVDTRIDTVGVLGYYRMREQVWSEPIYRNAWGLLKEFGDAEIAGLIAPRKLVIDADPGPMIKGPPPAKPGKSGAAPGGTETYHNFNSFPDNVGWHHEVKRYSEKFAKPLKLGFDKFLPSPQEGEFEFYRLLTGKKITPDPKAENPVDQRKNFDPTPRLKHQFDQAVAYTQNLLPTAVKQRDEFWKKLDTSSMEKYKETIQYYKDYFHDEIIGKLPPPTKPMNPKTRLIYETPKWKGYEVTLDLYDDVFCYGILLVPNDIKPGEKRPVVVCQHGLEGRPTDICDPTKKTAYYNSFGAQLANRGFIVFAPQAPYIGKDQFRELIRKGHPLKISLYSFIVAQHERIIDWLVTLPYVDANRIAYYGLSYGGKVAMRIGALVGRYCIVICSGDFNEWIWKNINLVWVGSYMFTMEYDMYEFDLGNTYNYAEMARLICPRYFMVERGHHDGVGLDEWVAHEYARVRYMYGILKIPERTQIEFFLGGHEIHGKGTFDFLHRHLNWPAQGKDQQPQKQAEENKNGSSSALGRTLPPWRYTLEHGPAGTGIDAGHCRGKDTTLPGPGTWLWHGDQQHLVGPAGFRDDGPGYFLGGHSTRPRYCLQGSGTLFNWRHSQSAANRGDVSIFL